MWLIQKETGEKGWHICQENQREPCALLVFVKDGGIWRTKLWNSKETTICPKNHKEEVEDSYAMRNSGFSLGMSTKEGTFPTCSQCRA